MKARLYRWCVHTTGSFSSATTPPFVGRRMSAARRVPSFMVMYCDTRSYPSYAAVEYPAYAPGDDVRASEGRRASGEQPSEQTAERIDASRTSGSRCMGSPVGVGDGSYNRLRSLHG